MDENQVALKDILMLLMEKLDAQMGMTRSLSDRMDRMEKGVVEGLLNPLSEAQDEFEFNDWKETYGKPLDRYANATKAIEGDDFDIYREAYNGSRQLDDESQEEFVQKLTENLEKQINALRDGLNLPPNTEVEIKSDDTGEVSVEVDGQPIDGSEPVEEVKTEEVEEVGESPVVAQKRAETEVAEDFNEQMENPKSEEETDEDAYDRELEEAYNKYSKTRSSRR